jgi:hypothetical protein
MLWFKKQPDSVAAGEGDTIVPTELPLALDSSQFKQFYSQLTHEAAEAGGLELYLASLQDKSDSFSALLAPEALEKLSLEGVAELLEMVFSARRRIFPALELLGIERLRIEIAQLLYGKADLAARLVAFSELLDVDERLDKEARKQAAKSRRAMYDFGAEMLHFNNPVKYPLMTRWVWDQNTVSGALREFIRGNDHLPDVPFGNSPEMFEGARVWLATQVSEQGLYRDVPFWVDLVMAKAYSEYFRSMAEGMLSADFGRGTTPAEQLKKFLGIDQLRKSGQSRVKRLSH